MATLESNVGVIVKEWRIANGISQANLSRMIYEKTGESLSTMAISGIENRGRHPRKETLAKLMALGILEKPSWLVWEGE